MSHRRQLPRYPPNMIEMERNSNALYRGVWNYGLPREYKAMRYLRDLLPVLRATLGHPKHRTLVKRLRTYLGRLSRESRTLVCEAFGLTLDGKPS